MKIAPGKYEKYLIQFLLILLGFIVLVSALELAIQIFKNIFIDEFKNGVLIDINNLDEMFGLFFSILIGLELFETMKVYLRENVFHAEIILLVAIIAVSRKFVLIDYSRFDHLKIFAMSFLLLSLALGYYLIKRSSSDNRKKGKKRKMNN
jgi:uncharacterized membrane protein (DUF373 family)